MTALDLITELRGKKCRCGRTKQPKMTFCASCYWSLSAGLRKDLYKLVGDGYEEAYEAAVGWLEGLKRA